MLATLQKIGEQLLEGQGIWARLTVEPKYEEEKKKWICPILFDCVNNEIKILKDEMELFREEESTIDFRYVNPEKWGRNGKKCALTVEVKNFHMLSETLFGKENGDVGSMLRAIEELDLKLKETSIYKALETIGEILRGQRTHLDLKKFMEVLDLGNQDEVVLFYSVLRSKTINDSKPIRLVALEGYEDFIIRKFATHKFGTKGIDFITGNQEGEIVDAKFTGRRNIHKIFQTTTLNYATGFEDFSKNFQISPSTLSSLDKSSTYALKKLSYIAGVQHIIIPHLLNMDLKNFDLKEMDIFLDKSKELLFNLVNIDTEIDQKFSGLDVFWVNYIAFESKGNEFKIINHIKDVNNQYLQKLIKIFYSCGIEFRDYIGGKYTFNLQTIYSIIPVRDGDKSKNNSALTLFKDVLEQRLISKGILYHHFIDLILCYWYGRYAAFSNIRKNESFDFAIKDAVFKYSALFCALNKLNLMDMENTELTDIEHQENSKSEFQQRMDNFFVLMNYSDKEKAIFYLGRVLSSIAYAQYKKGYESKPVLNKINFNGIDTRAIIRLSLDLAEKSRQYGLHMQTDWDFARFREKFNEKNWPLSNEQNVFYLMAGYSFGLIKSNSN